MDAKGIVGLLQYMTGGLILALVVWGFINKKIVPYWTYEELKALYTEAKDRLMTKLDPPPDKK